MSETKTFEELFFSSNLSHNYSVNSFKILLVSDINHAFMYLLKLKEWQLEKIQFFDCIFFLGNFLNLEQGEQENEMKTAKSEAEITSMLSYLESINLSLYYLGGRCDTKNLFKDKSPTLSIRSKNIHKKFFKLIDDLYILGVGGDIPSIETKCDKNIKMSKLFQEINFQNIYQEGYPYNTIQKDKYTKCDDLFYKDIAQTINNLKKDIKANNTTANIKYILLTHCGPFNSSTTHYYDDSEKKFVHTGSKNLQKIINENDDIIINIHGDNKAGNGICFLKNKCIINPGALETGNFAILLLERNPLKNHQWEIKKIEFLKLI